MPTTGTSVGYTRSTVRSIVPSPPSDTMRSTRLASGSLSSPSAYTTAIPCALHHASARRAKSAAAGRSGFTTRPIARNSYLLFASLTGRWAFPRYGPACAVRWWPARFTLGWSYLLFASLTGRWAFPRYGPACAGRGGPARFTLGWSYLFFASLTGRWAFPRYGLAVASSAAC